MTTVKDVLRAMEQLAPLALALPDDHIGLLAGDSRAAVTKIIVALDASLAVIDEAVAAGAELLVVHHPVMRGLDAVNESSYDAARVLKLLNNNIACIAMHTNLDACDDGVNDLLAQRCGLVDPVILDAGTRLGRVGTVPGAPSPRDYAAQVAAALDCKTLRFCAGSRPVRKAAVGSGNSTDGYALVVAAGCDAFVTGDVKYHLWLEAKESGMTLIDAGHFETEVIVCQPVHDYLTRQFPALDVRMSRFMARPFETL